MPQPVKASLWKDNTARCVFLTYWVDCLDYAYGFDENWTRQNTRAFPAAAFLANADRELKGAVAQLLTHRPNLKAILKFRMCCEIFLKVFLIQEKKLVEKDLKKLGHDIVAPAKECRSVKAIKEFQVLESLAHNLPKCLGTIRRR